MIFKLEMEVIVFIRVNSNISPDDERKKTFILIPWAML